MPRLQSRFVATQFVVCLLAGYTTISNPGSAFAQQPGDCVRLKATHPEGVPLHHESHNSFSGQRLPNGSVVKVLEAANQNKWFRVELDSTQGWIASAYVEAVVPCASPSTPTTMPSAAGKITVGAWNLEWLKDGKDRGFPEFKGAQAIPPRTDAEYVAIANIIRQLDIKVLILEEINGFNPDADNEEDAPARSVELDRLVTKLTPAEYSYVIERSGHAQRVAILFESQTIHVVRSCEGDLPNPSVDNASLFARQPLLVYCQIFAEGVEMNDFVVVGVHLASGQGLTHNHDQAMAAVQDWISQVRTANGCIPPGEFDVLIGGDFNASRFDNDVEGFWNQMEGSGWDVLADDPSYPSTRLAGKPPGHTESKIDYLIVSRGHGGLGGEEVTATTANVHTELVPAAGGGMAFRQLASDHLPVTVDIQIMPDND
jgi:endonuclease/exonuclease/phosphatase family metal-dependent hydrolase